MNREFRNAIRERHIDVVRSLLVEQLSRSPKSRKSKEMIVDVIERLPEVFEIDNGLVYDSPREVWNAAYLWKIRDDLSVNFSPEKIEYYQEVADEILTRNKHALDGEPVAEVEEIIITDDDYVPAFKARVERADATRAVEDTEVARVVPNATLGRNFGFGTIIVGVIVAVVAMCVALPFMLGLGIALIMLGSVIAYFNLDSRRETAG